MHECVRRRRSAARSLFFAALVLLAAPVRLPAQEASGLAPGTWVKVRTGSEVAGEGFAITAQGTRGRSLSDDKRTVTFDLNGKPLRVAKPGKTLEGPIRSLDAKNIVLGGPDEQKPIVIPRDHIAGLDVRRRSSKKGVGIVLGALGGGLIGYGIGTATSGPGCQGDEIGFDHLCSLDDLNKPAGALLGAAAGALIGGLVAPGARWDRDYPLDRVRVSVQPIRGRGVGLAFSISF
jgi:hypothetical protein